MTIVVYAAAAFAGLLTLVETDCAGRAHAACGNICIAALRTAPERSP